MTDATTWYLRCRACEARLAGPLRSLRGAPLEVDGQEMVPRGFYWHHPDFRWGQSPQGGFLIHVRDANGTELPGRRSGCCGPDGHDGMNVACTSGHPVGTEVGDCWTPHVLILHDSEVERVQAPEGAGPLPTGGLVFGEAGHHQSERAFVTWLHQVLDVADWFDTDVARLLDAWTRDEAARVALGMEPEHGERAPGAPVEVVWLGSNEARSAGVPLGRIEDAFARCAGPIRLLLY